MEVRPGIGGDWEKLTLEPTGDGHIAIRTCHGYYLSAQPDGRIDRCPGRIGGDWEKFTVQTNSDGSVSFRSCHGNYLCDEGSSFVWNRPAIGGWESFDVIPACEFQCIGMVAQPFSAL